MVLRIRSPQARPAQVVVVLGAPTRADAPLGRRRCRFPSGLRLLPPSREGRRYYVGADPDRRGRDDHPPRPARSARAAPGSRSAPRPSDGEEAVALARSEQPDLAILDVKMPRLDGIEAARRILDERPVPIVMLTAYGQDELVARAVEAGVFGYLVKPFREQDLLPAIAHGPRATRGAERAPRGGRLARRGAGGAKGDRAREGAADGEGGAHRGGGVRAPAQGEPGLGTTAARSSPTP